MLKNIDVKTKLLLGAFIVLGLLSLLLATSKEPETVTAEPGVPAGPSVDTFIPRGYVLIPIELVNGESLTSLVGDIGGVVDLYQSSSDEKRKSLKVGAKLKLLRAPLNPQQYAVLVKDSESSRLMSFPGPFIAVVQNPDEKGQEISKNPKPAVHIEYQN
jgi:hypothetical protein